MKSKFEYDNLFKFSEAKTVTTVDKIILLALIVAGVTNIIYFADWWFRREHISTLWLYVLLSFCFWYSIIRLIVIWINYLSVKKPIHIVPAQNLSVALFTTSSPGEPLEMFEKTLAACKKIAYPHTTYLLDDTKDPRFKECAEKNGAVCLELIGISGAKAGKINAALKLTKEDFILVMDPDHIPFPNFFEHTLGFFNDDKVGFVQVAQAYYNQYRSFTATGAAEQTYTFYGPTQMGLFGVDAAVAIGANCTFRRKALESIGGHGIGLAEDLITSIRLHAAGWKSIFNPVVVSRGLVPEDLDSFYKQQLKWARGVFEMTFVELPLLFKKLSGWQRLSYFTIGTYYCTGITTFLFTLFPFFYFIGGITPVNISFVEFVTRGGPIVLIAIAIYLYVQKWLSHSSSERGLHFKGAVLKYACWPIYLFGFYLSIMNAKIPYIPTAKKASIGSSSPFAKPLYFHIVIFVFTILGIFWYRKTHSDEIDLRETREAVWAMLVFASIPFIMSVFGVYAASESKRMKAEDCWDFVDMERINTNSNKIK